MTNTALKQVASGENPSGREPTAYERFRDYVQRPAFLADVRMLLGSETRAMTFVRVVLTAVQQTPDLLAADRRTLLLACMKAARDKLMPDGKEAVFNIYNTKTKGQDGRDEWVKNVQYLPMAYGLIKKLYESGLVTYIDAAAVYEKDFFRYQRGDMQKLEHEPTIADDPGPVVAAYAVVKMTNGEIKREVMARRDIEKVRASSKAPDGMMWKTFYDQGAIKSVIKRIYKQLPSAPELEQVIDSDNDAVGFAQSGPGIDNATESFTGERPAIEHKPGETIPSVVGAEAAPAVQTAKSEKQQKAEPDRPPLNLDGAAGATQFEYAHVRAAIDKAGQKKSRDLLYDARDMIRGVGDQFKAELTALADEYEKAM